MINISGGFSITKTSESTLCFGNNNSTGGTTVSESTLAIGTWGANGNVKILLLK